jgi:hypothetical protein
MPIRIKFSIMPTSESATMITIVKSNYKTKFDRRTALHDIEAGLHLLETARIGNAVIEFEGRAGNSLI